MSTQIIHAGDKTVLLTGGTGVFGRCLALELLRHDVRLIMLVRGNSTADAHERVKDIIDLGGEKVEVLRSDLAKEHLGMPALDYTGLADRATHILHAAASARFTLPIEKARLYNVKTTEQMINFAKECSNLTRFGFVGTALVAGNRSGVIKEDEFEHSEGFKNTYEQTKYEAETLMREISQKLPVVIFRPPLILPIVASEGNAFGSSTNALYLGINLAINGDLSFLPGNKNSIVDVTDSKTAAERIVQLLLKPSLAHMVYHITNSEYALNIAKILNMLEKKIGHPLSLEFCGSAQMYNEKVRRIPWYKFKMRHTHRKISSFISELVYPKIYDNTHTLTELGILQVGPPPIDIISSVISENTWKSLT